MEKTNFFIRPLEREHVASAAELVAETRTERQSGGFDKQGAQNFFEKLFHSALDNAADARVWGVFDDKELVGACAALPFGHYSALSPNETRTIRELLSKSGFSDANAYYFGGFGVKKDVRGKLNPLKLYSEAMVS